MQRKTTFFKSFLYISISPKLISYVLKCALLIDVTLENCVKARKIQVRVIVHKLEKILKETPPSTSHIFDERPSALCAISVSVGIASELSSHRKIFASLWCWIHNFLPAKKINKKNNAFKLDLWHFNQVVVFPQGLSCISILHGWTACEARGSTSQKEFYCSLCPEWTGVRPWQLTLSCRNVKWSYIILQVRHFGRLNHSKQIHEITFVQKWRSWTRKRIVKKKTLRQCKQFFVNMK